ncbi:MAG: 3'(2'),5'-bisphosphate nucleotidase CysQ [Magnetospirillum sp. WYHS-4]
MTVNISLSVIDKVNDIAKRAGRAIMKIYEKDFAVEFKGDASPVTEADQVAEDIIIAALRQEVTDAYPIVAEESVAAGHAPDLTGKMAPFWLVDPLDGTKEFVKRSGDFTVNIALIDGGRPVLGVVHAPAINQTFVGSQYGAFAETGGGQARPIACREAPADGLSAVVSLNHRSPETDTFLAQFTIKKEVSAGSSLKFCRVATGQADLYPRLGRTMEWDTAAGHAVLRYAGGKVAKLDGTDLFYGKPGFENPHFVAHGPGIRWTKPD